MNSPSECPPLKVLFVTNTLEITAAYLRGDPVDDLYGSPWEDVPAADRVLRGTDGRPTERQ